MNRTNLIGGDTLRVLATQTQIPRGIDVNNPFDYGAKIGVVYGD